MLKGTLDHRSKNTVVKSFLLWRCCPHKWQCNCV